MEWTVTIFILYWCRAAAIIGQTGPVVTLKVEKFGASYHGLGALLGEPAPERITGQNQFNKN